MAKSVKPARARPGQNPRPWLEELGKGFEPFTPVSFEVRCGRQTHRIELRSDGRLVFHHHTKKDFIDHRTMQAIVDKPGALPCRCLRILDLWRNCCRWSGACRSYPCQISRIPEELKQSAEEALRRRLKRLNASTCQKVDLLDKTKHQHTGGNCFRFREKIRRLISRQTVRMLELSKQLHDKPIPLYKVRLDINTLPHSLGPLEVLVPSTEDAAQLLKNAYQLPVAPDNTTRVRLNSPWRNVIRSIGVNYCNRYADWMANNRDIFVTNAAALGIRADEQPAGRQILRRPMSGRCIELFPERVSAVLTAPSGRCYFEMIYLIVTADIKALITKGGRGREPVYPAVVSYGHARVEGKNNVLDLWRWCVSADS